MWRSRTPATVSGACGGAGRPRAAQCPRTALFFGLAPCHKHRGVSFGMGRCVGLGCATPATCFLHIKALLLGRQESRACQPMNTPSASLGRSSASKKGDILHLAAFVFTWSDNDGNMQLLLILVSKSVLQTRDPCWPKQMHHSF